MPEYIYQHPKNGKTISVIQSMKEKHEYTDDKGVKWNRVFSVPNSAVDTSVGSSSKEDFLRMTQKKMTVGDMWDVSAQLSEKRTKRYGKDPVKEDTVKKYKKKCHGKRHPLE